MPGVALFQVVRSGLYSASCCTSVRCVSPFCCTYRFSIRLAALAAVVECPLLLMNHTLLNSSLLAALAAVVESAALVLAEGIVLLCVASLHVLLYAFRVLRIRIE